MKQLYQIAILALLIFIFIGVLYLCIMDLKAEKSIRTYNPNAIYHMQSMEVLYPNRILKSP